MSFRKTIWAAGENLAFSGDERGEGEISQEREAGDSVLRAALGAEGAGG